MTEEREEAIESLRYQIELYEWQAENINATAHPGLCDEYQNTIKSLKAAVKALEQEDILGKIRAEIENTGAYEQEISGKTEYLKGINYCLGVIDKYKPEAVEESLPCNHEWQQFTVRTETVSGKYGSVFDTPDTFKYCKKCGKVRKVLYT